MTRHLDPDRSQPPRFWPFPIDIDTSVCSRCSSMVPATDKAQETHRDHHRRIDALEVALAMVALTRQLSDPGSRTATSAAGNPADASPGSAQIVPTPPQEDTQGRGGVEDANQGSQPTDAGPSLLPGVVPPPAVFTPAAGGTKRVGRGSGDPGEHHGGAPAGTTGRLHLVDGYGRTETIDYNPPDYGKWTR